MTYGLLTKILPTMFSDFSVRLLIMNSAVEQISLGGS